VFKLTRIVARKSSTGGLCVYAGGGLTMAKVDKIYKLQ